MAKKLGKVFLGYEEEAISERNQTLVNYTVNKIGGTPDWPPLANVQFPSKCPLCGLHRLLIVQCYAPLDSSPYHRTLYLFACVSPNCWNQSESWACIRLQVLDSASKDSSTKAMVPSVDANVTWCDNSDDWDENDNGDTANGNFMNVDNDNAPSPKNGVHRNSDEDEESNSFDLDTMEQALGNLQVFDAHNANMSPVQGAVGAIGAPVAAAEFEGGDEPGLVTVDSPTAPANDVQVLLHQTAELPLDLRSRLACAPLQFAPKFIYVEEEWMRSSVSDDRVTELLNKYRKENAADIEASVGGDRGGGGEDEQYEDAAPAHGDRLFHAFVSRLRHHPGQILRYTREAPPLLGAPLPSAATPPESPRTPAACARCGSRLLCELQLVPEFAETLRLQPGNVQLSHLHFLSVLVFTCAQSCWQPADGFVQETVLFQPEVI